MSERPETHNTAPQTFRLAPAESLEQWGLLVVGALPYLIISLHGLQKSTYDASAFAFRVLPVVLVVGCLAFLVLTGMTSQVLNGIRAVHGRTRAWLVVAGIAIAAALMLPHIDQTPFAMVSIANLMVVAWMVFAVALAASRMASVTSRGVLAILVAGSALISFNALTTETLVQEANRLHEENIDVRETNGSLHQQLFDAQTMYMDTFEQLRDTQIRMNNQFGGYVDPYQYGLSNPGFYPFHIFDDQRPLDGVPTLQELAGSADSDAAILERIIGYYGEHVEELGVQFDEKHGDRLKALFAMYILHISHPYGNDPMEAAGFVEYLQKPTTHCALISLYQSKIMDAFGLEWRIVGVGPLHQWLEASIDGQWEIFDGTANVWVNQGYSELLEGKARRYRAFYTPWLDETKPEARSYAERQSEDGYFRSMPFTSEAIVYHGGVGIQRALTPGLGIYYPPELYCEIEPESCAIYLVKASPTRIE